LLNLRLSIGPHSRPSGEVNQIVRVARFRNAAPASSDSSGCRL